MSLLTNSLKKYIYNNEIVSSFVTASFGLSFNNYPLSHKPSEKQFIDLYNKYSTIL